VIRIEAVATVRSVVPSETKPLVRIDLACLPVVRAFVWERPWARHVASGDLVRIVGYPLPPAARERGADAPVLAVHAEAVFFEAAAPAGVRWQARAMLDELVLRPRGAVATISARTPAGHQQLDCEATRQAAAVLSAHADGILALSGDVGCRGSTIIYHIRSVAPAHAEAPRPSSQGVSHGRSESAPAPALR